MEFPSSGQLPYVNPHPSVAPAPAVHPPAPDVRGYTVVGYDIVDTGYAPGQMPNPEGSDVSGGQFVPTWKERLVAATLVVSAAFSLSGNSHETVEAARPAPLPSPAASPSYDATKHRGPCIPYPFPGEAGKRAAAEKCLPAMQAGTVALVNFDLDPSDAQAIAAGVEATVPIATNNIIHVKVELVAASSDAKDAFIRSLGVKGCVDPNEPSGFSAAAADETMPELRQDDMVMGISREKACGGETGGEADQSYDRLADVYDNYSSADRERVDNALVASVDHELLHLYQLGHAGRWYGSKPDGSVTDLNGNGYTAGKPLDLKHYLADGTYSAYNGGLIDGYVMGAGTTADFLKPNVIDDAKLQWPEITLEREASPAIPAGPDWIVLNNQDAAAGKFVTTKLEQQAPLADHDSADKTTHDFDTLNFLPAIADGQIYGASLVLSDRYTNLADLGAIYLEKKQATTVITFGGQQFEVKLDGKNISVRQLTPVVATPAPAQGH